MHLLIALAFVDLATWLLPHVLTWPLVVAGLGAAALGAAPAASVSASALGAGAGFAAFALVSFAGKLVTKKEAIGFGDVWLLAGLGAWLGVGALLPVVLLASIQGSVYGIALLALGRGEPGPLRAEPAQPPTPDDGAGGDAPTSVAATEGCGEGAPVPALDADEVWVPPRHAVPFGPFLVAGGLEWLYFSGRLVSWIPGLSAFR